MVLLSSMNVRGVCVKWKIIGLLLKTTHLSSPESHKGLFSKDYHVYKGVQVLIHRFSFIVVKQHKLKC